MVYSVRARLDGLRGGVAVSLTVVRAVAFVSAILFASSGFAADAPTQYKAKRVVIMVIDGPRYTETWGEPQRQYIPHMNKELAPLGVFFSDFANDGPTYTEAGHTALVSCYYQE